MTVEYHQRFAQHVTSIAFSLQLSKPQIIRLVGVASNTLEDARKHKPKPDLYRILGVPDSSCVAGRVLEDKGLVYAPVPEYPGYYLLTEPGKLVLQLLQMAGLVQRIEDKVAAKVAEKEAARG